MNLPFRMPESALRVELKRVCAELEEQSEALAREVQRHATEWWAWMQPKPGVPVESAGPKEQLDRILEGIRALTYARDQESVSARHFPALVCAPPDVHRRAVQVNALKGRFEATAKAMANEVREEFDERQEKMKSMTLLRYALRKCWHADLNYWQARRPFVVLETAPRSIGYTWARHRAITTESVERLRQTLLDRSLAGHLAEETERDLKILEELPASELLGKRMTWTAHPRANIVVEEESKIERFSKSGSLPILLPMARLPLFRALPPTHTPKGYRTQRSDVRLEDTPLLTSAPVFRFKEQYRRYVGQGDDDSSNQEP